MQTIIKKFDELSAKELYEIMQIRVAVFVVEQNCAYQDLDGLDEKAYHILMQEDGKTVAYLRVLNKGDKFDEVSLGRIISLKRRCGIGTKLLKTGLQVAKEKFGADKVKVGAQLYAKPFYESVGFTQVSDIYDEDGIKHIEMLCALG